MIFVDPHPLKEPLLNKAIIDHSTWLDPAMPGRCICLQVAVAAKGTDLKANRFSSEHRLAGRIAKLNGEHAVVIAHDIALTTELSSRFLQYRSETKLTYNVDDVNRVQLFDTSRQTHIVLPTAIDPNPIMFDIAITYENIRRSPGDADHY
ncbi:hypothetical protein [Bradyrhizobium sp. F1.13.3]|uniref:hypothetical protein n=1 Tax=Bradyrhizobium sp. F1.13.3 TaxID=3156351 RepID=UPI00339A8E35